MKKYLFPLIAILSFAVSCQQEDSFAVFSGYAQGGSYTVKYNPKSVKKKLPVVREAVDSILNVIDITLSGYNKSSMLSRLNAGETIFPNELFLSLYEISFELFEKSEGAFDVSCGPLFDVWGFGFTSDSLPDSRKLEKAVEASGMSRLRKDIRSVLGPDGSLSPSDLLIDAGGVLPKLNFNAIAQGFSCDQVASYLHSIGVRDMLVDIGEIYCEGHNPKSLPWAIGVDSPVDGNMTPGRDLQGIWHSDVSKGQGLVTSGNYRKYYLKNGRKYAHTIDPRTAAPVTHNLLSASVVADDATTADALATWCMVVGLDDAIKIIRQYSLEACLIYDNEGEMQIWQSPGFGLESVSKHP